MWILIISQRTSPFTADALCLPQNILRNFSVCEALISMVISLFSLLTENNYDNIIRSARMFKVSLLTLDESKQISPQGSVSHGNLNVSPPLLNQFAMKFSSLVFLYISAIHQKSHTVIQHKAFISSLRHSIVSLV